MRLRDIIICLLCIVVAAALFITAGLQLDYINSERQRMKLIINEPLENAPPSLAFATVAMGAFRGLVVDILWMRADKLKNEGQFFDAKQLAEWITVLQPRFPAVWEFHAWNMAYNISVAIPETQPEQRWRWVRNGYELLRDRGIPLNPKSIILYRQLALIFQHKIGGVTDDAHKYYKLQMVNSMEPLLGPADNRYFKALAQTPTDWQQIADDPNITPLITALKSADQTFVDDDRFVANYLSLRQSPGKFNPDAFKVIDNFRGTEALQQFDVFAKANHLRDAWKLDPVLMEQLNQTYGPLSWEDPNTHLPLDWRHPHTHAIYWAVKGLQVAGKKTYSVDETNADRIVAHSLQGLFRSGKLFVYDIPPEPLSEASLQPASGPTKDIFFRSDLRMFQIYNKSTMAILEKYKSLSRISYESLQNGHRNMLINALFSFYQAGHVSQAQKIYNQLRRLYPMEEFKVSLVEFTKRRLRKEVNKLDFKDVKEMVQMLLRESYFRYAVRDDNEAFGREKMAKEIHDLYRSTYKDEHRINLPDLKVLRYVALTDFINDSAYPTSLRLNLLGRMRIERPKLYKQLRQLADQLMQQQKKMLENPGQ